MSVLKSIPPKTSESLRNPATLATAAVMVRHMASRAASLAVSQWPRLEPFIALALVLLVLTLAVMTCATCAQAGTCALSSVGGT